MTSIRQNAATPIMKKEVETKDQLIYTSPGPFQIKSSSTKNNKNVKQTNTSGPKINNKTSTSINKASSNSKPKENMVKKNTIIASLRKTNYTASILNNNTTVNNNLISVGAKLKARNFISSKEKELLQNKQIVQQKKNIVVKTLEKIDQETSIPKQHKPQENVINLASYQTNIPMKSKQFSKPLISKPLKAINNSINTANLSSNSNYINNNFNSNINTTKNSSMMQNINLLLKSKDNKDKKDKEKVAMNLSSLNYSTVNTQSNIPNSQNVSKLSSSIHNNISNILAAKTTGIINLNFGKKDSKKNDSAPKKETIDIKYDKTIKEVNISNKTNNEVISSNSKRLINNILLRNKQSKEKSIMESTLTTNSNIGCQINSNEKYLTMNSGSIKETPTILNVKAKNIVNSLFSRNNKNTVQQNSTLTKDYLTSLSNTSNTLNIFSKKDSDLKEKKSESKIEVTKSVNTNNLSSKLKNK